MKRSAALDSTKKADDYVKCKMGIIQRMAKFLVGNFFHL